MTISVSLKDALSRSPDLIYFAGYANDTETLLDNLPTAGQFSSLPVMGGDAFDELRSYQSDDKGMAARFRLHYTAFAHPDEWDTQCGVRLLATCRKPPFFTEYSTDFDPHKAHIHDPSPYGFDQADADAILSYDAMSAFTVAIQREFTIKATITPSDLRTTLASITGRNAIQGVSGQIFFTPDGDTVHKAILVLCLTKDNKTRLSDIHGQFIINGPMENLTLLNSHCMPNSNS